MLPKPRAVRRTSLAPIHPAMSQITAAKNTAMKATKATVPRSTRRKRKPKMLAKMAVKMAVGVSEAVQHGVAEPVGFRRQKEGHYIPPGNMARITTKN